LICPNCQTDNRESANFCKECRHWFGPACPRCGTELPEVAKYCDHCGHDLASPQQLQNWVETPLPVTPIAAVAASPKPAQSHLHQYIPEELLAKLEAAESAGGMVGERRIVTILFCDMKGSTSAAETLDPEDWTEIINGAFEHMISPVYRYEGIVARLMGDGILAFFGAPIAHEDDAVRAVLAGMEIVSETLEYRRQVQIRYGIEIDVRVGINTGRVVVGAVGSDLRLEYTALGDAINLAARMEQTAEPGTVQIAEDSYKLVAPLFDFEALGDIEVKGKKQPVRAYRALRPKATPGRLRGIGELETALIGREDEFAMLRNALSNLRQGRGQIVFLSGEAGLGKSRLIRELHALWRQDRATQEAIQFWLQRPVASYQAAEPYRVLKNQFRLMYGIGDGTSRDDVRRLLKEKLSPDHLREQPRAFEAVAKLLGVLEEGDFDLSVQGELFKQQLFSAALASIREMALDKPAVLVLDDLHWADPASTEVIEHLFQLVDSVPIMFLCASRPDRNVPGWDLKAAAAKGYPHRFSESMLQPLTEENSLALLDGLLLGMASPPKLQKLILEKSEGNPFFIEEVVRTLINDGIIRQDEENRNWYTTAEVNEFDVPGNLQALLAAQFDRLSEDNRQIMQMASVIGRSFGYDVLQRILDNPADLDQSLTTLQQSELIIEEASIPRRIFRFRNSLAQDTLYRSILRKLRREYHCRVGEALLSTGGDQLDELLPALAYHFYQALDDRAVLYNEQAGEIAFQLYANREAATYFGQAIELIQKGAKVPVEQVARIYFRYGRVLELNSQFAEALAVYEEIGLLAEENQDQAMKLAALVARGTIYSTANDHFDAIKAETLANEALPLAQGLEDEPSEAKILWNLLNMYRLSERPSLALGAGERSMELARKNGLLEQLAYSANDMTHVYIAAGLPERAREVVEEAIQLWRELGNQPMLADSLATASLVFGQHGDSKKAIALSDESYKISVSIDNLWGQSYSRMAVGMLYWNLGRPDKAIEMMEQCVQLGAKAGFLPSQLYVASFLALAYANLGDFDRALPLARQTVALAAETMTYYHPSSNALLGTIQLLAGNNQEAEDVYNEILAIRTYLEPLLDAALEEFKCQYLLSKGNSKGAIRSGLNLVSLLREVDSRIYLPAAWLLQGQAFLDSGDFEQADDILSKALSEAEDLGFLWPMWQILATMAKLEVASENLADAQILQDKAQGIFETIAEQAPTLKMRSSLINHPYWNEKYLTDAPT